MWTLPNVLHIMRTFQLRLVGMKTKLSSIPFEPWKLSGLLCFPVDLSLDTRGMPHICTGQHSARDLTASLNRSPGLVWVSFLLPNTLPFKIQSPPSPQVLSSIKTAGLLNFSLHQAWQWAWDSFIMLTSLLSLLSGITVLCCLLSCIWRWSLPSTLFASCFWSEGNSSLFSHP